MELRHHTLIDLAAAQRAAPCSGPRGSVVADVTPQRALRKHRCLFCFRP